MTGHMGRHSPLLRDLVIVLHLLQVILRIKRWKELDKFGGLVRVLPMLAHLAGCLENTGTLPLIIVREQ